MLNRGMSAIDRWRKSQAGNADTGSLLGRSIVLITVLSAVYAVYRLTPALIRGSSNGGAILMMNRTKVHSDSLMYFDGVRHRAVIGAGMVDRRGRRSGGRRGRDVDDDFYDDDDSFYDDDDAAVDDDDAEETGSGRRSGRGGRSRRGGGRNRRGRGSSRGKRGSKRAGGGVRGASKNEDADVEDAGDVDAQDGHGHAASGADKQQQAEEEERQQRPAAPSPEPPKPAPRKRKALVDVPETPGFVPLQRPLPGEAGIKERGVTADSHRFAELALASQPAPFYLNPARHKAGKAAVAGAEWPYAAAGAGDALMIGDEAAGGDADVNAELERRLVVAIGMGVHSGNTDVPNKGLASLPVFNTLLPTFLNAAQPHHIYRFYFAFDHNDPIFESADMRAKIEAEAQRLFKEENERRWHPEGYVPGSTIDGSTLLMSIHWVHCNYAGKPAWAHSDAVMASYVEGADYAIRMNDDTAFPTVKDWADRMIGDLRGREIPNLGVVGPACSAGANWILTHDFTHRTHAAIFGYQYPRSLPDWSSDDWITYVYKNFGLMTRREDAPVEHRLHGQRYKNQDQGTRLQNLNAELAQGAELINEWAQAHVGRKLPFTLQPITCC